MYDHMVVDIGELEEKTCRKGENCFIIATSQGSINYLMWTVFSILLRSKSFTDHLIFAINGPDKRTGDPWVQDTKQKFLEVLRDEYQGNITINRVWSRIGHAQAVESVVPWVHTEFYTISHDDIILLDPDWGSKCLEKFQSDPKLAICGDLRPFFGGEEQVFEGKMKLGMPHINSVFACCRKVLTLKCGARWWGYHIEKDFRLSEEEYQHMMERFGYWFEQKPRPNVQYGYFATDIGSWMLCFLEQAGFGYARMDDHKSPVVHIRSASWANQEMIDLRRQMFHQEIQDLDKEINNSRFAKIYNDFKEEW